MISPMIERDDDGTSVVRMSEARVSASPFGSVDPQRKDGVFFVVLLQGASINWLATPDEARALATAILEVAAKVRGQEAA